MKRSAAILGLLGVLAGCNPTLNPKITNVTSTTNEIMVSGKGFSHTTPSCATLSLIGMPSGPPIVNMGAPNCTNGVFAKFPWKYSYVEGCQTTGQSNVVVLAVDNPSLDLAASKNFSIPWGPQCAFVGSCGDIGQFPCPSGCFEGTAANSRLCECGGAGQPECTKGKKCETGLVPVQQGSSEICEPCGGQGQPLCTGSNPCQTGLNPSLPQSGSGEICTTCGYAQGAPCPPDAPPGMCGGSPPVVLPPGLSACATPNPGGGIVETCYSAGGVGVQFDEDGSCTCLPDTSNSCPEVTSTSPGCANPQHPHCH